MTPPRYLFGRLVARLSLAIALLVLVLGIGGAALAWNIFTGKIDAARVPPDPELRDAIDAINTAQRVAIEELRTSGLPVSRADLLEPGRFAGEESVATLDRRLAMLADAREVVLANQREVVGNVSSGFDDLIGQLNELARRTTAAEPPPEPTPPPDAARNIVIESDPSADAALFLVARDREEARRRLQALDAAKVALLSLMTEVQRAENRERIRSTLDEISSLERLVTRAMQVEVESGASADAVEEDIALRTGAGRARHIASVLEKRKASVIQAVLGDWTVLSRIDAVARQLEHRRQALEFSEIEIRNLQFQRNLLTIGLVLVALLLAVVIGAAGDVARAILDSASYLGNM